MNRSTRVIVSVAGVILAMAGFDHGIAVCWAFVFIGGLGFYLLSFISGFAADLQAEKPA